MGKHGFQDGVNVAVQFNPVELQVYIFSFLQHRVLQFNIKARLFWNIFEKFFKRCEGFSNRAASNIGLESFGSLILGIFHSFFEDFQSLAVKSSR